MSLGWKPADDDDAEDADADDDAAVGFRLNLFFGNEKHIIYPDVAVSEFGYVDWLEAHLSGRGE